MFVARQSRPLRWSDVIKPRVPNAKTASPLPLDSSVIFEAVVAYARAEQDDERQRAKTTSIKMPAASTPAQKPQKRKRGRPKKNSIQKNQTKKVT